MKGEIRMKKLSVFSPKSGLRIALDTVGSGIVAPSGFAAFAWSNGGWSNYSDSWLNSGWNNYPDSWQNNGWNNYSDSWINSGWNNYSDSWQNNGWNNYSGGK